MSDETWLPCVGHPRYEVSDLGRVRRIATGRLVAVTTLYGYRYVALWDGNRNHHMRIHRLVAKAFIPNDRPEAVQVNHIDGDKTNNVPGNLEWCTCLENARHSVKIGLQASGERIAKSKLTKVKVREIREMHGRGYSIAILSKAFGVHRSNVHLIVTGKTWANV